MPRKTRMYLPGVPAHVVQRGHNRDACFFAEDDFRFYCQVLAEGLKRYGAELHAYCLMTNHVHLLVTPQHADSISRLMQHVGRQYVQYVNKTYRRSGTLWKTGTDLFSCPGLEETHSAASSSTYSSCFASTASGFSILGGGGVHAFNHCPAS